MKRVLLIAPFTKVFSGHRNYGDPPLGVHRIASYLNANGHEAIVYDCNIHQLDGFLKYKYNIIGISILNDTLIDSLELLNELIPKYPETLFVAGGSEPMLNYQEIFDNSNCNIVVTGEGELPLLNLCNDIPLHEIQGLIIRNRSVAISDNLLWDFYKDYNFSAMEYRLYWSKRESLKMIEKDHTRKTVRIVTSSHCLKNCEFCSLTRMHEFACGAKVKPAKLNKDQIQILLDRILEQLPETNTIYFCEDSILPTKKRIFEFCEALSKYKNKLQFLVQTETGKVDRESIKMLAEVGVVHITFGVESVSESVRISMNKRQDSTKIENIIDWCNEFNVRCYYLIILFYPSSKIEDLILAVKILGRWIKEKDVTISIEPFAMPYRGARLYNSEYEFDYKFQQLSNGNVLKHPYIVFPKDREVRQIMEEFRLNMEYYLDKFNKKEGHQHRSKDHTGKVYIELLEDLLKNHKYM